MPSIKEMFPGRFLNYREFSPGEARAVTIAAVQLEQVRLRQGFQGRQGYGNSAPSEPPEPMWLIWFRECAKPMELRKGRASRIAAALNEEDSDKWIGRTIEIYRGIAQVAGENVEGLLISDRIPLAHHAIASADPYFDPNPKGRYIPHAAVLRFVEQIGTRGERWDGFIGWIRGLSPHAFTAVAGQGLDAIPASVLPAMKEFLLSLGIAPVDQAAARQTQIPAQAAAAPQPVSYQPPMRTAAPHPASAPYQAPGYVEEIQEDDIPF